MAEPAIIVHDVHKEFTLPQHKLTSLKQAFVHLGRSNVKKRQKVLNGINLVIPKGDFFGIVGRNGSGKSTLLKILAGVYAPTAGSVEVRGLLTPFIELGVGFNPELSGRDNVFLNGALLGFSHREMEAMYNDIVEFAELADFMDQKLKNYSSGMQVRLAFSIAIRAKSDILLIDEVLAVGDANFQKKCMEVFQELKREGRTIVFITHSMDYVREFCDHAAVIDRSKLLYAGDVERAIDIYNKLNVESEGERLKAENESKEKTVERFGNGEARIIAYKLIDRAGKETVSLASGEQFSVELDVTFNVPIKHPTIGVMFRKEPHENLFGINTFYQRQKIAPQKAGDTVRLRATGTLPLAPGNYYVSFAVSDQQTATHYTELDNLNNIVRMTVEGEPTWGLIKAKDITIKVQKV